MPRHVYFVLVFVRFGALLGYRIGPHSFSLYAPHFGNHCTTTFLIICLCTSVIISHVMIMIEMLI